MQALGLLARQCFSFDYGAAERAVAEARGGGERLEMPSPISESGASAAGSPVVRAAERAPGLDGYGRRVPGPRRVSRVFAGSTEAEPTRAAEAAAGARRSSRVAVIPERLDPSVGTRRQ